MVYLILGNFHCCLLVYLTQTTATGHTWLTQIKAISITVFQLVPKHFKCHSSMWTTLCCWEAEINISHWEIIKKSFFSNKLRRCEVGPTVPFMEIFLIIKQIMILIVSCNALFYFWQIVPISWYLPAMEIWWLWICAKSSYDRFESNPCLYLFAKLNTNRVNGGT